MDINTLLPHIKLKFNIDHPSYEECYLFGYECGLSEIPEEENPFKQHSHQAEQWLEGWWAAVTGEGPLFEENSLDMEDAKMFEGYAANDHQYCYKHSFLSLVLEIGGAIAASAIVGYQLLELVA